MAKHIFDEMIKLKAHKKIVFNPSGNTFKPIENDVTLTNEVATD